VHKVSFDIENNKEFKIKMLNWANRFSIFCFLDGNGYGASDSFPTMLAVGALRSIALSPGNAFASLKNFFDQKPSWLFGHFGYELMVETLGLSSRHASKSQFGAGFFFEPEILIVINEGKVEINAEQPEDIFSSIERTLLINQTTAEIQIENTISEEEYFEILQKIKEHIQIGDCYEINFCQQFIAQQTSINPVAIFCDLMEVSPNPFSSLYKLNNSYCISASPERFIKKKGAHIISQPMKGTAARSDDPVIDEQRKKDLYNSSKDRSENVMIVDLVRNDLSKFCKEGSVKADSLFDILSFPSVHQMVSNISGEVEEGVHWTDIIRNCFPMGSMTGAPKRKVAELIDKYEKNSRGLYSGSIGYIDKNGDFDFNVVIRSIFYDSQHSNIHFWAGGGITIYSEPKSEYEECFLKAKSIMKVLAGKK